MRMKIVYINVLMRLVSITPVMLNLIDYHRRLKLIELMKVIKIIKVIEKINKIYQQKGHVTIAIDGRCGSGKTTLINLVPRFYDVTAGQILIDGVDIRDLKLEDLYRQIGYVPQKGVLFSGTVKSNISFGNKQLSDAEIKEAAEIAQATEFINKLNKKYDSEIAQGGANVSGGQKQKLSIARAIAVKPKIYIFDDSFSALDFKSEAKLRRQLLQKTKGQTTLIVSQRISTIMNVDKIIVLDQGKIVGQGTHRELLKNNSVYQEIAYSQLSDEELKLQS